MHRLTQPDMGVLDFPERGNPVQKYQETAREGVFTDMHVGINKGERDLQS